jgi:serine/threonine protein kinase/CheY-like chemotaxis protein
MRFLVVDDDPEYREILRYYLSTYWPRVPVDEVAPTGDGIEAADINVGDYDTILLDYPIDGERGFQWLRELKSRDACPPIILFAANGNEFLAVDAIKAGAASYFPKLRLRYKRLIDTIRIEIGAGAPEGTGVHLVQEVSASHSRKYRFLETLHSSDLSSVYLAKVLNDDSRVVFKVIRHVPDSGGEDLFDRFLQEYELVAAIDHPNVVKIYELGVADDHAYIAMEYLPCGSLALRLNGPLEPRVAVDYVRQIASSLTAIHSSGILHRDLKPSNIMFREDDTLALIDFGLAKQMELQAAITGQGQIFGTPYYMSPEQGHGQAVDARSDIYNLGCMFYEMLRGRRPFVASTALGVIYKHAHEPRPLLYGDLRRFEPVLNKMYAADPDARFRSVDEVLEALAALDV